MKDIAVVMITVDRSPKRNYLTETLDNLKRTGMWQSSRLHSFWLCDSRADLFADNALIAAGLALSSVSALGRRTANQNVAAALKYGAKSGAPWVLFLEDDIDVCDRFLDGVGAWLDWHAFPDCPIYAFGAAYDIIDGLHRRGETSWRYPVDGFYGTQAFATRATDALSLAWWLEQHEFSHTKDGTAYDLSMHDWADAQGVRHFLASVPSFVQHIGMESAIAPRRDVHVFKSWPGREWSYSPHAVTI